MFSGSVCGRFKGYTGILCCMVTKFKLLTYPLHCYLVQYYQETSGQQIPTVTVMNFRLGEKLESLLVPTLYIKQLSPKPSLSNYLDIESCAYTVVNFFNYGYAGSKITPNIWSRHQGSLSDTRGRLELKSSSHKHPTSKPLHLP